MLNAELSPGEREIGRRGRDCLSTRTWRPLGCASRLAMRATLSRNARYDRPTRLAHEPLLLIDPLGRPVL